MQTSRLSRRTLLRNSALLAGAACVPWIGSVAQPGAEILVSTPIGKVRGLRGSGVCVFRGIPFAEPLTRNGRFQPAQAKRPVAANGVIDATRFGAAPYQPDQPRLLQSEDCLQLNLWTPENTSESKLLPVFVWVHGGGFTGGYAFDPVSDGVEFAREGIVVVTVAYRLGVFGFLDLEPLLGAEYRGTSNNALRDLILALEWIQHNIRAFGGDPSRVTIGGESAGAKLCDILMGTPAAQALFHGVISESGGAERIWPRANSEAVALGFGKTWQALTGQPVSALRTADPERIIAAQQKFMADWPQHFPLRPQIDGDLLKQLPIQIISQGSTRGKRLLLGTNRDESALFIGPHPAHDATAADLGNLPLDRFTPVYKKYAALYPELSIEQRRIRAVTAEEYWVPSMRLAAAHANQGGETYVYRLDFAESSGRFAGYAYHSLDVGLVWEKPHKDIANAEAEAKLARQVHAAWISFLQGGAPAAAGLPAWPEWNIMERRTMLLDTESRLQAGPQQAELRLWQSVL